MPECIADDSPDCEVGASYRLHPIEKPRRQHNGCRIRQKADHAAATVPLKESVDCREDRALAGPDLPLPESYAQRTSSHAKSFCVFQYNYRRIHTTAFSAYDQADPFG